MCGSRYKREVSRTLEVANVGKVRTSADFGWVRPLMMLFGRYHALTASSHMAQLRTLVRFRACPRGDLSKYTCLKVRPGCALTE